MAGCSDFGPRGTVVKVIDGRWTCEVLDTFTESKALRALLPLVKRGRPCLPFRGPAGEVNAVRSGNRGLNKIMGDHGDIDIDDAELLPYSPFTTNRKSKPAPLWSKVHGLLRQQWFDGEDEGPRLSQKGLFSSETLEIRNRANVARRITGPPRAVPTRTMLSSRPRTPEDRYPNAVPVRAARGDFDGKAVGEDVACLRAPWLRQGSGSI